jgi:hypothetical protein
MLRVCHVRMRAPCRALADVVLRRYYAYQQLHPSRSVQPLQWCGS